MDTSPGEVEGGGEEAPIAGKRKWPFKQLRSRLFGRLRRREVELGAIKQSQSSGDVTGDVTAASEGASTAYDSEDDCSGGSGTLSSRALSHESIFQIDQSQSGAEPARVLSQESIHGGRIRALQLKLQQQTMHLGPPPLLIPSGKRMEDSGATSEDDGLPRSPPDINIHDRTAQEPVYKFPDPPKNHSSLSLAGTGSEEEEQCSSPLSSRPLSPVSTCPDTAYSGVDLSSPAQFTPSLDTSAARHRMSVKPRNQRASTKNRRGSQGSSRPPSENLSDLDLALSEKEEEEEEEEEEEREQEGMEGKDANEEEKKEKEEEKGEKKREVSSDTALDRSLSPGTLTKGPSLEIQSLEGPEGKPWCSAPSAGEDEALQSEDSNVSEDRITTNPLYLQPLPLEASALLETKTQTRKTSAFGAVIPKPPHPASTPEMTHPSVNPLTTHNPVSPVPPSTIPSSNYNATAPSTISNSTLLSSTHNPSHRPVIPSTLSSPSLPSPNPTPTPHSLNTTLPSPSGAADDRQRPPNPGLVKPPVSHSALNTDTNNIQTSTVPESASPLHKTLKLDGPVHDRPSKMPEVPSSGAQVTGLPTANPTVRPAVHQNNSLKPGESRTDRASNVSERLSKPGESRSTTTLFTLQAATQTTVQTPTKPSTPQPTSQPTTTTTSTHASVQPTPKHTTKPSTPQPTSQPTTTTTTTTTSTHASVQPTPKHTTKPSTPQPTSQPTTTTTHTSVQPTPKHTTKPSTPQPTSQLTTTTTSSTHASVQPTPKHTTKPSTPQPTSQPTTTTTTSTHTSVQPTPKHTTKPSTPQPTSQPTTTTPHAIVPTTTPTIQLPAQSSAQPTSQVTVQPTVQPTTKSAPATRVLGGPTQKAGFKRGDERGDGRGGEEGGGGERGEAKAKGIQYQSSERGGGGGGGGEGEGVEKGGRGTGDGEDTGQNQSGPLPSLRERKSSTRLGDPALVEKRGDEGKQKKREGGERTGEKEDGGSEKREEEEVERRSAFGVKLRPTSQSLKYHSKTIQSDPRVKRGSVEVMASGEDAQPIGVDDDDGGSKVKGDFQVLRRVDCLASTTSVTVDHRHRETVNEGLKTQRGLPPADSCGPETSWMSLARGRTESLQNLQTTSSARPETSPETASGPGGETPGLPLPAQPPPPASLKTNRPPVKSATQPPSSSSPAPVPSSSSSSSSSSSLTPSQPSKQATAKSSSSLQPPPYSSLSFSSLSLPPLQQNVRPMANNSSLPPLSSSQPSSSSSSSPSSASAAEPSSTSVKPSTRVTAKPPSLSPPPYGSSTPQRSVRLMSVPSLLSSLSLSESTSAAAIQPSTQLMAKSPSLPPPPYPSPSTLSPQTSTRQTRRSSLPLPAGVMSLSSQPIWMELAKKKSRAWSDKNVD